MMIMISTFENIVIKDDKGYFFSYEFNALLELDFENWKCKYLTSIEDTNNNSERLFANIVYFNNWLILIPMQARHFCAYNLSTKEIIYLEIPFIDCKYKMSAKFLSAHIVGNALYVVGHSYPGIIRIDLDNWESKCIVDLSERYNHDTTSVDVFRYGKCINDIIYVPFASEGSMLEFDTKRGEYSITNIMTECAGFSDVFQYGSNFVLISLFERLYTIWNPLEKTSENIAIEGSSDEWKISEFKYSATISCGDREIFIPLNNNKIVVLNKQSREIFYVEVGDIVDNHEESIAPIRSMFVYQNRIFVLSGYTGEIYELDIDNHILINTGNKITMKLEKLDLIMPDCKIFKEGIGYSFNDFLIELCDWERVS